MYVCMYVRMYYVCMYVRMYYVCMYVRMYHVCMYVLCMYVLHYSINKCFSVCMYVCGKIYITELVVLICMYVHQVHM
jgi:hypothetical protein